MIDKAYLLYLICMAIFGLLCYKFGHAMGMMEELQAVVDWFMGWDLSEDDPARRRLTDETCNRQLRI